MRRIRGKREASTKAVEGLISYSLFSINFPNLIRCVLLPPKWIEGQMRYDENGKQSLFVRLKPSQEINKKGTGKGWAKGKGWESRNDWRQEAVTGKNRMGDVRML